LVFRILSGNLARPPRLDGIDKIPAAIGCRITFSPDAVVASMTCPASPAMDGVATRADSKNAWRSQWVVGCMAGVSLTISNPQTISQPNASEGKKARADLTILEMVVVPS
jgi:hypothetical protein